MNERGMMEIEISVALIKDVAIGILRRQGEETMSGYLIKIHRLGEAYERATTLKAYFENMGLSQEDAGAQMRIFADVQSPDWQICKSFDACTMRAEFVSKSRPPFAVTLIADPLWQLVTPVTSGID